MPSDRSTERPQARRQHVVGGGDAPVVVVADIVVADEVVALAGDHHVVVAVHPHLRRPAGHVGGQRRRRREHGRLGLLAAEATAHPPHLDGDRRTRHAKQVGGLVLHLGGVLGGAVDGHLRPLAGDRQRRLALKVEMLLPADRHPPLDAMRRAFQGGGHIAALHGVGRQHEQLAFQGGFRRQHRLARRIRDLAEPGGAARLLIGLRHHAEDRLADIFDHLVGEQRVVAEHRADVVLAGNVARGQHGDDAGGRAHRIQVDGRDLGVSVLGGAELHVDQTRRLQHVVDISRGAGDVPSSTVVRNRVAHHMQVAVGRRFGRHVLPHVVSHRRPLPRRPLDPRHLRRRFR